MRKLALLATLLLLTSPIWAWNTLMFHGWDGFAASDVTDKGIGQLNYVLQNDTDAGGTASWIYHEDGWWARWTAQLTASQLNTVTTMNYGSNYEGDNGSLETTGNWWYMFNVPNNPIATPTEPLAVLATSAQPVTITSVTQQPVNGQVSSNDEVLVTVELSAAPCPEEYVYLRYSTDSWVTSSAVEVTGFSDTTGSASITMQDGGTAVSYYVFTTTVPAANWGTQDLNYLTLHYNNNGGNNFTYTVTGTTNVDVTVQFSVNLGALSNAGVSITGDAALDGYSAGAFTFTDADNDNIWTGQVFYPAGSPFEVHYTLYHQDGTRAWVAEDSPRILTLIDTDPTQVIPLINFNNMDIRELTGVVFKQSNNSAFTNFENDEQMDAGSNLQIEAEVDGVDPDAVSAFSCTLHYAINQGGYTSLPMQLTFSSEATNKSYWQTTLVNGEQVNDGDAINFYVTATDYNGPQAIDENGEQDYSVTILAGGIAQDVTLNFSVNLGSTPADSVSIQGSAAPLSWDAGSNILTDENGDHIWTGSITFAATSPYNVEYKFTRYTENVMWDWESNDNRALVIDDTQASYDIPVNYWNQQQVNELSQFSFTDNTTSAYTNFTNGDNLPAGSNLMFEAAFNGIDYNSNSGFGATLHYNTGSGFTTLPFSWGENLDESGTSLWRATLNNAEHFTDGQTVEFYITATDYNGPELTDNNGGNNYSVGVAVLQSLGTPQNPIVTINGADVELSWQAVDDATSYRIEECDTPDGTFSTTATTGQTSYTITGAANVSKKFYRVIAVN